MTQMTDPAHDAPSPGVPDAPLSGDAVRPLKLLAMDADDLAVVSALAQDAIAAPTEMRFLPGERAFVLVVDRLAREAGAERSGLMKRRRSWQRRRCALDFRTVLGARRRDFPGDDATMVLLAVTHEPGETSDVLTLHFAAGASVRLEVEAIEVRLTDLGPAWKSDRTPRHP